MGGINIGVGVSITRYKYNVPPENTDITTVPNKKLLIDARTIEGGLGTKLPILYDASGLNNNFTQDNVPSQPTLNTFWSGSKSINTNGNQFSVINNPILTGLTSFSIAWVGQFDVVTGGPKVAFNFGNYALNGFDFNANRNSTGKFGVWQSTISHNDTTKSADTNAHFVTIKYNASGNPKWTVIMDGVPLTMSFPNLSLTMPTTRTIFAGVTGTNATFSMNGNTGLWLVCSGIWDQATEDFIRDNAKFSWGLLP